MVYTTEQYKTVACQLVDMLGKYNGYDMSFEIQPRHKRRFLVVSFWDGEKLECFYFSPHFAPELNMQGLRDWMQRKGLV